MISMTAGGIAALKISDSAARAEEGTVRLSAIEAMGSSSRHFM